MESKESIDLKVLCSTSFLVNALSHFSKQFSTLRHYFMNSEDLLSNHKIPFLSYRNIGSSVQFSSVQSLSRVRLFATPWIAARQATLSITNSQSSLRLTFITSHLSHPLLSPAPPAPNPSQHQSLFQWINSLSQLQNYCRWWLQPWN